MVYYKQEYGGINFVMEKGKQKMKPTFQVELFCRILIAVLRQSPDPDLQPL
jgi:hypothetical protein